MALLAVSVIVAVVQSTELQWGCLLRGQAGLIRGSSSTDARSNSLFDLQQGCGRASELYAEGHGSGKLRSVQPIPQPIPQAAIEAPGVYSGYLGKVIMPEYPAANGQ